MIDKKVCEQVKRVLLTPIVCIKWNKEPFIYNNIIYSGQEYYPSVADEDMSNFAVGFYNRIYEDIIDTKSILEEKKLKDKSFAGDTMNSFRSIAKLADFKEDDSRILDAVMKYYNYYHCLANFWLLPMDIGRKSKKLNYFDSVDLFLNTIDNKEKYETVMNKYGSYMEKIPYNKFLEIHFLKNYKPKNISYNADNVIELINAATEMIQGRADEISKSTKAGGLYEYFTELKLIKE